MGESTNGGARPLQVVDAGDRYRALVSVTAALSAAFTVDEVAAALGTSVLELVGGRDLIIALLDEEGGPVRFELVGVRADLAARLPEAFDRSATGEVLRTGEPNFLTSRAEHDLRYPATADWWEEAHIEAAASLPLSVGGRRFGAVRFGFDRPQELAEDDRQFLVTVADVAAQALHRASLLAAEQSARLAAEAGALRAQRLGLLTSALGRALTVEEVADAVAAEVQAATLGDTFSLRIVTADGRGLQALRLGGVPRAHGERFMVGPADVPGALAEVVETRRPVFLESARAHEERYGVEISAGASSEAAGVEGLARLPLLVEDQLLGVLSVGYLEPHLFSPEERLFFVTVADVAAQALQRALRTERLRQLQGLSDLVLARLPLDQLIVDVGERLADYLRAEAVRILLYDQERRLLVSAAGGPAGTDVPLGRGVVGRVAATRAPVVVEDTTLVEVLDPFLAACRSVAAVPLIAGGRLVGVLAVGRDSTGQFSAADMELLGLAAARVAVALDRSQAFEAERMLARTLQASLLPPSLPVIPGVALAARYLAAGEGIEVGGDFYDIFSVGGGAWLAIIGDVCGRGPAAAAMTGLARHTVRAVAVEEPEPAAILRRLNLALGAQAGPEDFATALCARIEPSDGGLDVLLASAGHCHPVLVRAGGKVEVVALAGSLLGAFDEIGLGQRRERLGPGDALLLYTDGVIEAAGAEDRYGEERLAALLAEMAGRSPAEIVAGVEAAVMAHCAGTCDDDLALLAVGVPAVGGYSGNVVAAAGEVVVDLQLPPGRHAPAVARQALGTLASRLSGEHLDDARLAVSELVTNAVRYGSAGPGQGAGLRVLLGPAELRIEVRNLGGLFPFPPPPADDMAEGGRGIAVVKALADASGLDAEGDGVCAWCSFVLS